MWWIEAVAVAVASRFTDGMSDELRIIKVNKNILIYRSGGMWRE